MYAILEECDAYLADAGEVGIGSLNVYCCKSHRNLHSRLTPELSRAAKRRRLERTVRPRAHELPRARQTRWRSDRGTAEGGSKLLPPSGSRTLSRGWIETGSACSASPSRDKRTQGR